ncbi:DNA gyrase inhibitor YacG [Pontixanthobacter aestiaquae]|uniref:DNA gyrase inhibitor YacG n=1 Tax=Pontixanthobacter aestiaquae TaxID=1509367 RepID=A0A844Z8G2_9SPHN|nr:DNA gyrase inhibitor YacG [Pontixanthobacter aestiaquae]MDN3645886.1 DNA gyrase inhibitor YacG [Pontixanthobacter aestiaquae]MXO83120.1 DNA gyrase inhibitor YacG [Pontixanthobacter aestiaquae]
MSAKRKLCPICKKPRTDEFHPFCSRGCRDRDLNQWFGDGYAVPGRPASLDEIAKQDWEKQD